MLHDTHTATIEMAPELVAKLNHLAERRIEIHEEITKANAALVALKDKKAEHAQIFAMSGKRDPLAIAEAAKQVTEAEGALAMADSALKILEREQSQTEAMLRASKQLEAIEAKRQAMVKSYAAAETLDQATEVFNAAYEAWHLAHGKALENWQSFVNTNAAWSPHWPSAGAGFVASTGLHPDVINGIKAIAGSLPPRDKVVTFEITKFGRQV